MRPFTLFAIVALALIAAIIVPAPAAAQDTNKELAAPARQPVAEQTEAVTTDPSRTQPKVDMPGPRMWLCDGKLGSMGTTREVDITISLASVDGRQLTGSYKMDAFRNGISVRDVSLPLKGTVSEKGELYLKDLSLPDYTGIATGTFAANVIEGTFQGGSNRPRTLRATCK